MIRMRDIAIVERECLTEIIRGFDAGARVTTAGLVRATGRGLHDVVSALRYMEMRGEVASTEGRWMPV